MINASPTREGLPRTSSRLSSPSQTKIEKRHFATSILSPSETTRFELETASPVLSRRSARFHASSQCSTSKVLLTSLLVLCSLFSPLDSANGASRSSSNSKSEKRVVCYYTNWSAYRQGPAKFLPDNINPYLCTHLVYAFGGLTSDSGIKPFDKYQDIDKG
jgi:hypothetical protein